MKAILFVGVLVLLAASPLAAQVGHEPAKSPYADLLYKQEFTPYFGYDRARVDAARIAPKSAAIMGVRYEIYLGGPVSFSADLARSAAKRTVIDPFKPAATREIGTQDAAVYIADVALAIGLTGRKSWNNVLPQVRVGVGVLTSAAKDDSSGYAFGTPFAFHFGAGMKVNPGGRWQLRADVTERLFKQTYPDTYYRLGSDNTAVLTEQTPRKSYTHRTALTVGVSYLFAR